MKNMEKAEKIIDAHVHVYPDFLREQRNKIAEREEWFGLLTSSPVHKWCNAEELIKKMDYEKIDKSYVTTFAFYDQGLCNEMNSWLFEQVKKYPDRLIPLAVVSPSRRGAEEEIRRRAEQGFVGIGELNPDGQFWDITDDRKTWRIAKACDEYSQFLLIHTAEQVGHHYIGKGGTGAEEAAKFARDNPLTKTILAHFGGGLWAYEAMPEMRAILSNTYYDTAAMPWLYGSEIINSIYAMGCGNKLIFGSDSPILTKERYDTLINRTVLTDKEKRNLMRYNMENFINKSPMELNL